MSEEEKEAIETIKEVASDDFDTLGDDISPKMAQNILNVLEKQQEEIEELTRLKNIYKNTRPIGEVFHDLLKEKEYVNKDKIRDILKDLDEFDTTFFNANSLKEAIKNSLNRLLEEN